MRKIKQAMVTENPGLQNLVEQMQLQKPENPRFKFGLYKIEEMIS